MRTRYGVSPWIDGFPDTRRPSYQRLRGEHTARVVIVGAGLIGCATAYACAVAGLRPLLIDTGRIGQASAGRSAGLLSPEPGPSFKAVVDAHGLRAARKIFTAWRRASLDAAALLRRLGVKCGLDGRRTIIVARAGDEKALRREYEVRAAAGLDVGWLKPPQVRAATRLEMVAAIRPPDAFALDPYRACLGLAAAAVRRGAIVFERSAAAKIRLTKNEAEVIVDGGIIRAQTVIVTTGTATPEFKPLRRHFKRRERYFVLTEPVPTAVRKQLADAAVVLQDTHAPDHLVRWTDDDRLLVAGADQDETPARKRDAVLVQRTGQLMYELLTMYPAIAGLRPEFGWEATYGETVDGLMYVGPHRNYPRHLFALGGNAGSIAGAFLAARILARAVEGEVEKGDEVFGWTR